MADALPPDEGVPPPAAPDTEFRWMDELDDAAPRAPREPRPPMPAPPARSAGLAGMWWVLLLLPIGLGAGWLAGNLPAKQAKARTKVQAKGQGLAGRPAIQVDVAQPVEVRPVDEPGSLVPLPADDPDAKRGRLSNWTTVVASAEEESRRTGKPVMLDFNAAWCPPCQAMKRDVFEESALGVRVRRTVVPVSVVDRSRENGSNSMEVEALMQSYSIEAFPTLVVYMPGSGKSMQKRGYGGPEATTRWIENAASAVR